VLSYILNQVLKGELGITMRKKQQRLDEIGAVEFQCPMCNKQLAILAEEGKETRYFTWSHDTVNHHFDWYEVGESWCPKCGAPLSMLDGWWSAETTRKGKPTIRKEGFRDLLVIEEILPPDNSE
jgi:ssDNA-binding Zn-finger/Zn-ribbon topoisomerase 1